MPRTAGVHLTVNEDTASKARVIYLGVPTFGMVSIHWHAHLMQLQSPLNRSVFHGYGMGFEVGQARNYLVEQALHWQNEAGHTVESVFFVDDDCLIPPYALTVLLARNLPIVSGLYYAKSPAPQPLVLMEPFGGTPTVVPKNQVIECYAHGMGCTLIKLNVFRELLDSGLVEYQMIGQQNLPQFFRTTRDELQEGPNRAPTIFNQTEDVYFLNKAAQLGYKAHVDTSVFAFHFDSKARVAYPLETWNRFKQTGELVLPGHETEPAQFGVPA
jgi:hypothetical protein